MPWTSPDAGQREPVDRLIYMLPVIILYFTVGAYFRKGLASIGAGDR